MSAKARRLFCANTVAPNTEASIESITEVPFTATEAEEVFVKPEGPVIFEIPGPTQATWLDDDLPECSDLIEGFDDMDECRNTTEPEPIIRWRDMVFEKLISQTWKDAQSKIDQNANVGGVYLDPLEVDLLAGKPLNKNKEENILNDVGFRKTSNTRCKTRGGYVLCRSDDVEH